MAAEIHHWRETSYGPQQIGGQILSDDQTMRLGEFGDSNGYEGFVTSRDDKVIILTGKVITPLADDGLRVYPKRLIAALDVGQSRGELFYADNGEALHVNVRNIGEATITPELN